MKQALLFFSVLLAASGAVAQLESDTIFFKYREIPDDTTKVNQINDEAFSYWSTQPLLTERLGKYSLALAENLKYAKGVGNSNHILGIAYHAIDNYDLAMEKFYIALPIYEDLGNTRGMGAIYLNIASVFDDIEEYDKAKLTVRKSIGTLHGTPYQSLLGAAYNNAGVIYEHLQQFDSAIYFVEQGIKLREALGDTIGVARGYNNIGVIYKLLDDHEMSFEYFKKSLALNYGDRDLNLKSSTYLNFGQYYLLTNRYSLAKAYLDTGLQIAKSIDLKRSVQLAHQHMKDLALAQNDYRLAFEHFYQEMQIDKERINEESTKKVADLQLQYTIEKSEKELALLENDRNEARFYRNLTLLGLLATLIIGVLGITWWRFRSVKNREVLETQHRLTESQLENALLREKELTLELDQKKRELTAYTINFVQKSELLTDLKESINKMKGQLPETFNRELGQLNRKVEESFRLDQDWEDFKSRFEQVHHLFFSSLKERFPDLTSNELKLCALLRLNFNLKEAAQIMGVAPESVKTARYRLKKKLGLETEESLTDFILTFDAESLTGAQHA